MTLLRQQFGLDVMGFATVGMSLQDLPHHAQGLLQLASVGSLIDFMERGLYRESWRTKSGQGEQGHCDKYLFHSDLLIVDGVTTLDTALGPEGMNGGLPLQEGFCNHW
jgi:hypothetical protein